jgi:NAD(P)-dependent dehydrogenase (short-subunit alcohol dehydrogenase family)
MKNIVIIGAGKGIGLACARNFCEANRVFALSKSRSPELDELQVQQFLFDSRSEDYSLLDQLPEQIHGLVYCPGSINLKPFHRLTKADFQADFEQNVLGAVGVVQKLLPSLKKAGSSSVVFFSTVASKLGMPFHASIAASKAALEGLTKSLAAEYSANNIRFNCIAPSLTDTPLAEKLLSSEEKREAAAQRHPLKAIGDPNQIAALVNFLISDHSSWITGQIIGVDGGMGTLKV